MDKRAELENLIKEKLHIESIDKDATLATYGLDSLDVVSFLLELEDRYGIAFESDEINDLKTVGELFNLILNKIA